MSDLKSKFDSVRFVPVQPTPSPAVGFGHILFGVIYPASVVAFELATRVCAKDLFDPMPTLWHVFAVCLVPASNLWTWWTLSEIRTGRPDASPLSMEQPSPARPSTRCCSCR